MTMRVRNMIRVLGSLTCFYGLTMLAPLFVSLIYRESDWSAFLSSFLITLFFGLSLYFIAFRATREITNREGFLIVTLAWALAGVFGALPYIFTHTFATVTDALFETISGLTTTGASVMTTIEDKPHGILFWRALTHWIGGMGIILLGLAILPLIGVGGMQLFRAEVPGPSTDKIKPRIADTAKVLWKVYLLLTLAEVVALLFGGMNLFDAVCHSFATIATGGFSTRNLSLESYNSTAIEMIVSFFMILAGINFALHFRFLTRQKKAYADNGELRLYLGLIVGATAVATVVLKTHQLYGDWFNSFRYALFQVSSIITCTGFSSADFDRWPDLLRLILVLLMFVGAMVGSTGGGLKVMRVLVMFKNIYLELYRLIHPKAVIVTRVNKQAIDHTLIHSVLVYITAYVAVFVVATLILTALNVDLISAATGAAATLGGVGPGLAQVGAHGNYAEIPLLGKWVLCFCMYAGRLEIYTIIILLVPAFWRK